MEKFIFQNYIFFTQNNSYSSCKMRYKFSYCEITNFELFDLFSIRVIISLQHYFTTNCEDKRKVEEILLLSLQCASACLAADICHSISQNLSVATHAVSFNSNSTRLNPRLFLLKFQRFKGKHTGERTATVLHQMLS